MSLRVRLPNGTQIALRGVDFNHTIHQLKEEIKKQSNIVVEKQKLKIGFPPKDIPEQEDQEKFNARKLNDVGIKSGETLVVEETNEFSEVISSTNVSNPITDNSIKVLKPENYSDIPPKPSDEFYGTNDITTIQDSTIAKRVIEADNSCLFNAVAYVLEGNISRKKKRAKALRRVVYDMVRNNPLEFNEAILGRPNKEYSDWIMRDDSWGGSLEIMILSKFYGIQIVSFDVITCRQDVYNQDDPNVKCKVFLLYDGIHYDALALNPMGSEGPEEIDLTIFPILDANISNEKAMELVKQLHQKHEFTDTANFNLKCLQCGEYLKGEKDATQHAKKTGHTKFGENK